MNRVSFTNNISKLLQQMIAEGEMPIGDWWIRTAEIQNILFKEGLSKCDGYKIISAHQTGHALDIYFQDKVSGIVFNEKGEAVSPLKGFEYWHDEWTKLGGKPMISWDRGHFEG